MEPSLISALSGAPATLALLYFAVQLMRDGRASRRDFLEALAAERKAIERVADGMAQLHAEVKKLGSVTLGAVVGMLPERLGKRAQAVVEQLEKEAR